MNTTPLIEAWILIPAGGVLFGMGLGLLTFSWFVALIACLVVSIAVWIGVLLYCREDGE